MQKDTYKELEQPVGKYSKSHKIETVWFFGKKLKRENPKSCKNELWKKPKHPKKSHFLYTGLWIGQISIIPGITSMSM